MSQNLKLAEFWPVVLREFSICPAPICGKVRGALEESCIHTTLMIPLSLIFNNS